ncbi:12378_t:CDS:2 [Acaulospora colombiana]|uniref:12378_t:CDS:1 n=1 Tax=Acaulospora colombiana TaxID=27376 RepID=A0ACA9LN05_9GLOM|nr:12378_t:CDS:2 [Acaulospora colombiana]
MSPPPQLCFPFTNKAKGLVTHHPNDSASTATLTSMTSAATKLHFTEDTESYFQTTTPPIPSRTTSAGSVEKPGGLKRAFTWRRHESTSTLVSEDHSFKKTDEPAEIVVDTALRLNALRKKMAEETIDYFPGGWSFPASHKQPAVSRINKRLGAEVLPKQAGGMATWGRPIAGRTPFIIPAEDGHLSEYVAASDKRLHWISSFTGSAGTAIVSKRSAYLFVDSRYWVQAERELDSNWTVMKTGTAEIKDWLDWAITCPRGSKLAIDSRMISHERATRLYKGLYDRGSKLSHPRQNLVDLIWEDRPKRPRDPVYVQPVEFTGRDIKEKLSDIRRWIRKQNAALAKEKGGLNRSASSASNTKPTKPRENVKRSNSVSATTPPPIKGATPASAVPARLTSPPGVKRSNSVPGASPALGGPDRLAAVFLSDLASIAYVLNLRGSDIPFNPVFTAYLLVSAEGKTVLFIEAHKVPKEVRDYLHENGVSIREYGEVWTFLRGKQWGEGKVIIHPNTPYAVSLIIGSNRYTVLPSFVEETKAVKNSVEIGGMRDAYLRDGAAVVRWLAWLEDKFSKGYEITEWEASEKLNYFREHELLADGEASMYMGPAYENIVATGSNAALPHYNPTRNGSKVISRHEPFLFDSGGQYRDGTCDTTRTATPLQPGHIITNEPGYYKDGEFGVRIESTLLVKETTTKSQKDEETWLTFERLTQVPIQTKMVRASILSKEERQWIKDHNAEVRRRLEPYLQDDKRALKWLIRESKKGFGNEGKGSAGLSIEWD